MLAVLCDRPEELGYVRFPFLIKVVSIDCSIFCSARMGFAFIFTGTIFSVISSEILTMRRFGLSDRYAFVLDRMLHSDSSFRRHTGPPINGALLSTEYIWWRSIVFSGVSVTFVFTSDMSGVL